jgi:DnaJ-domain-containing protein 1
MAWLGGNKSKGLLYPREHPRFSREGLTCPLGTVADLSAGGAKVRVDRKPTVQVGETLEMMIGTRGSVLSVRAIVVWVRKGGWRTWEIGLQFRGVYEELAKQLVQLAMTGSTRAVQEDYAKRGTPTSPEIEASIEIEDLYEILQVGRKASTEQVIVAYRALARKYHPDFNPASDAAVAFTKITKAYRVLKDPDTRARYDVMLARAVGARRSNAA